MMGNQNVNSSALSSSVDYISCTPEFIHKHTREVMGILSISKLPWVNISRMSLLICQPQTLLMMWLLLTLSIKRSRCRALRQQESDTSALSEVKIYRKFPLLIDLTKTEFPDGHRCIYLLDPIRLGSSILITVVGSQHAYLKPSCVLPYRIHASIMH